MPIVLRLTKGSELTFAELDGNFTDLDGRLDIIEGFNLNQRVTRLEAAGTPIYFDSDDVMVMLDSVWGGQRGGDFFASNDSVGLASFDSARFTVSDSGHVSWIERLATKDSDGTASFDSEDFVVLNGHVTINPNSPGGRVAGKIEIDSTGVASFDSDDFNVNTNGHVTLTDSAVRTRISAIDNGGAGSFTYNETLGTFVYTGAPDASTSTKGIASFNSSDFNVSSGVVSLAQSGAAFSTSFGTVGSLGFFFLTGGSAAVGGNIAGSNLKYGVGNTDGSGERINAMTVTNATTGLVNGTNTQFGHVAFKRVTGGNQASPGGTWKNLGPGHASTSGSGVKHKGGSFHLFVRVS